MGVGNDRNLDQDKGEDVQKATPTIANGMKLVRTIPMSGGPVEVWQSNEVENAEK